MPTQKKIEQVEDLKQVLERASITVSADYRGLRVQEMDQMRRKLREANVQVRVIKNNLLRLAAEQSGMASLMEIVEGAPAALILGYDDPTAAARAATEYAQSAPPTFAIRGAFLDGQVVSPDDLKSLVSLPPKPVMLAQLAGQLQSPLTSFLGLLESPLRELSSLLRSALSELPGLLEARAGQLEASGEQPQAREEGQPEEQPAGDQQSATSEEQPVAEEQPEQEEQPEDQPEEQEEPKEKEE